MPFTHNQQVDNIYQQMVTALENHDLNRVEELIMSAKRQGVWDYAHKFSFKSITAQESREVNILEAAAFSSWPGLCRIIELEHINLRGYESNILNFSFLGTLMDNVDSAEVYVEVLVSHGADINAQFKRYYRVDNEGEIFRTPLQLAIELGDEKIIEVLKKAGADFTVKVKASSSFSGEFKNALTAQGHSNDNGWIHFKDEGVSLAEYAQMIKTYKETLVPENHSRIDRDKVLQAVIEAGGGDVEVDLPVEEEGDQAAEQAAEAAAVAAAAEALAAQQAQEAAAAEALAAQQAEAQALAAQQVLAEAVAAAAEALAAQQAQEAAAAEALAAQQAEAQALAAQQVLAEAVAAAELAANLAQEAAAELANLEEDTNSDGASVGSEASDESEASFGGADHTAPMRGHRVAVHHDEIPDVASASHVPLLAEQIHTEE